MPGGFEERAQRQSLLREMDAAPRRSARVPVPNPRYHNVDNVARRGAWLGFAELLAAVLRFDKRLPDVGGVCSVVT